LSLARLGGEGLAACNPLLAFQLMNNFTMCHGAIIAGTTGPSGALFSRGVGTTAALVEAVAAIESGECTCAIAGGADSALHPVTRAELARDGFVARGLVPAEAAALVALQAGAGSVAVEGCAIAARNADADAVAIRARETNGSVRMASDRVARASAPRAVDAASTRDPAGSTLALDDRRSADREVDATRAYDVSTAFDDRASIGRAVDEACERARVAPTGARWLVIAPWGPPASEAIRTWAAARMPAATIVDLSISFGDALAASPALAWVAAIDLVDGTADRAMVIGAGTDGDVGVASFRGVAR